MNGSAVLSAHDSKFCGAKSKRTGKPCRRPAGAGTDHVGQGRCKHHGGSNPIKHGRYSKIRRERIRELIEDHADDPDPLDVMPELAAARALFVDFIERYYEWRESILAWHESFHTGDSAPKPRQVLDVSDAYRLLAAIAKIAQQEKRLRLDGAISRQSLRRILTEIRRAVDQHVQDQKTRERLINAFRSIRLG